MHASFQYASRTEKRQKTLANDRMTEINSSESSDLLMAHRGNTESEYKTRILAQEEVDEQIRTFIALLTRQLENLTWLIQGWTKLFPKGEFHC